MMTDLTASNDAVAASLEALRTPVMPAVAASRKVSSYAALNSSNTMREMADKLAQVREGIQSLGSGIDSATVSMEAMWAQIQRDREQLADLRRSETMIEASLNKAREPSFTR